jgi:hypothetical protein
MRQRSHHISRDLVTASRMLSEEEVVPHTVSTHLSNSLNITFFNMDSNTLTQRPALGSRLAQIDLLTFWWKLLEQDRPFSAAMQEIAPGFFTVMKRAIKNSRTEDIGDLLSEVLKRSQDLSSFLTASPVPFQTAIYCNLLNQAVDMLCPAINTQDLDFNEMTVWLSSDAFKSRFDNSLLDVSNNVLHGLMGGLHSTLRQELTLVQYYKVSKGFQRSQQRGGHVVCPPYIMMMQHAPVAEQLTTADEYRATGERIRMQTFCWYAKSVPEDTTCSVCMGDVVTDTNEAGQHPTVTACGHYFHEKCLDDWVNNSAMPTSNTCPSCRAVMCRARPRVPKDMLMSAAE